MLRRFVAWRGKLGNDGSVGMVRTTVRKQVERIRSEGWVWDGWMGGQWAVVDLFPKYAKGKTAVVLCSGAGATALNLVRCGFEVVWAVDFLPEVCLLWQGKEPRFLVEEPWWVSVNEEEEKVPRELVRPVVPEWVEEAVRRVIFICADALDALEFLPEVDFVYLNWPAVFEEGFFSSKPWARKWFELYADRKVTALSERMSLWEVVSHIPARRVMFGWGSCELPDPGRDFQGKSYVVRASKTGIQGRSPQEPYLPLGGDGEWGRGPELIRHFWFEDYGFEDKFYLVEKGG